MKKTIQDFDLRNEKKKIIETQAIQYHSIRVGQLWRYYEGINIGNEQSKGKSSDFKRVGVIIGKQVVNKTIYIAPITTQYKKKYRHFQFPILPVEKYGIPT